MSIQKEIKKSRENELLTENRKIAKPESPKDFKVKLNKYGFIHIPKKFVTSLPFGTETSLTAQIRDDQLTIIGVTKTSTNNS
ncbi:MAG: hypothetical protein IAX21_03650 [Candidatus Bathyarchaeota archaeon]|nr:MAG: hypothetical protein IAX21_03650 [Candidatus Bathyarchaeota archaeon]